MIQQHTILGMFTLLLFSIHSFGQGQGCYQVTLEAGERYYQNGNYVDAITTWQKAKLCSDAKASSARINKLDGLIWKAKDSDGDKVVNGKDACPQVAASTKNGCPLPPAPLADTDRDGIPDKDDQCPNVKGSIKHQGCPDSDQDGIADNVDKCPTLNGPDLNSGCPMSAADSLRIEQERRDQAVKQYRDQVEKRRITLAQKEDSLQKAAEIKATRDQIGGLFGGGGNKGYSKGNTGKPGNQGNPNIELGITRGTGSTGGNLGNRSVVSAPKITDNSQLEGIVVIAVCVDASGNVVSAEFIQKGSTNSSSTLVNISITNAKKWKFSPGDLDKECGTITYRFKVV